MVSVDVVRAMVFSASAPVSVFAAATAAVSVCSILSIASRILDISFY